MTTDLITTDQTALTAGDTETRFSTATLLAAVPAWVDWKALSAIASYGYGHPIPAGAAPALRAAADLHEQALAPSSAQQRHELLLGLRSATIIRDEDVDEAEATLTLLRNHLSDVPIDILREGARAYCNAPGRRFFPKSAGELRTFTNPLMAERAARASRLRRLAEEAEAADRARAREAEILSPDQARAGFDKIKRILAGGPLANAEMGTGE